MVRTPSQIALPFCIVGGLLTVLAAEEKLCTFAQRAVEHRSVQDDPTAADPRPDSEGEGDDREPLTLESTVPHIVPPRWRAVPSPVSAGDHAHQAPRAWSADAAAAVDKHDDSASPAATEPPGLTHVAHADAPGRSIGDAQTLVIHSPVATTILRTGPPRH